MIKKKPVVSISGQAVIWPTDTTNDRILLETNVPPTKETDSCRQAKL